MKSALCAENASPKNISCPTVDHNASLLDDLVKNRVDSKKPRKEGLTYVIDKLQGSDKENWELLAPFVDVVKIYGALPLFTSETSLIKKIKFYHDLGIHVSIGTTNTEFALAENSFDRFVKEVTKIGFDIIEIGENVIDLDTTKKKKIVDTVKSHDIDVQWKVGKRDPRHQLSLDDTLSKIEEIVKLGSKKIILEANQGFGVGIYDENGLVKWGSVAALTNKYPPSTFIFEAPIESQQFTLIAEFGERVNLSEISVDSVASVESERRGILSKSAFGVANLREDPEGGPAAKFIYYIIKTKHPIEQSELINLSYLPRRTVQHAIEELKNQGLIIERNSLDDARKRVYHPVHSEWL
ncbi:MAG TPA: phosphosulfolactate synthase [Nitrosopumilaceae archaeon]|nr:phosphosulfolactate synthase [Nitrosopumilaceae archaeon]